jgi:hypothetical protein
MRTQKFEHNIMAEMTSTSLRLDSVTPRPSLSLSAAIDEAARRHRDIALLALLRGIPDNVSFLLADFTCQHVADGQLTHLWQLSLRSMSSSGWQSLVMREQRIPA